MKRMVVGGLLVLIGIAGFGYGIFSFVMDLGDRQAFLAPGELLLTVPEAGRFYVFHDHQTVFQGTAYSHPEGLPNGWTFSVTRVDTGDACDLKYDTKMSESMGGTERKAIAYAHLSPGDYRIQVRGAGGGQRVLSVGPAMTGSIVGFFGAILLAPLACLIGIGLAVWGLIAVLLARQKRAAAAG